jgi:tetratricopeptide (TPR) repeat protein
MSVARAGAPALVRFEKALLMSRKIGDMVLQRRALRGMAASARMQGNNQMAIKHLESVLSLSNEMGDYTGDADAYGSIADIYADMGQFEKAAKYYDQYINKMQEDGQAV